MILLVGPMTLGPLKREGWAHIKSGVIPILFTWFRHEYPQIKAECLLFKLFNFSSNNNGRQLK